MRLRTAPISIRSRKVNAPIKVQRPIRVDIDIQRLEVSGGVDKADLAGLHEIVRDDNVLLVRSDLDVVRTDGGLNGVWIVEALGVVEVGDVERGDVVSGCDGS